MCPDETAHWAERDACRVWHGFTQMASFASSRPVIVERAEGRELIDVGGRRYLDAISSLWVTTMGHRVPELDAALREQIDRVAHSTLLGNGNKVVVELAEALSDVVPVDDPMFMFASDGAAAVEQALKIAFQFWWNTGNRDRTHYLVLGEAYHGDTVGSLSLGDTGFGTGLYDPLRFDRVVRTPGYNYADWADRAIDAIGANAGRLAAAVIEPLVQGASGMLIADADDVRRFAVACNDAGVLLICDEVATGFGRTGRMFASEVCGIRPDVLCLGKGLSGGYLPMSATVASRTVANAFLGDDLGPMTFYHGHSYGGNALAAAVALRHLQLFAETHVLDNVAARSEQLAKRLAELRGNPFVGDARVRGLMAGVELSPPEGGLRWGRRVCAAAVDRGVLLRPLGDVVVLMPILTSTAEEVDRIVDTLEASMDEVCGTGA